MSRKSKKAAPKKVTQQTKAEPKAEEKGMDFLELSSVLPSSMSSVGSVPRRGARAIAEAYSTSPWLHAVTRKIAEHVACVRYVVHQEVGTIRRSSKELELVTDHPMTDLIWQPNAFMDGWTFMAVSQLILDLQGDLLWEIRYGQDSELPVALLPIPAHWVQSYPVFGSSERAVYKISADNYREEIPAERVIRMKTPNPCNPFGVGVGLGLTLGDEVDTDEQVSKWVKSFFNNNARPDFMVGIEGLDSAGIKRAQIAYENTHRASTGGHRPYFYAGKLSVHEFSNSYGHMQVNQLRDFERQAFLMVYGVPPEILGWTGNSNRATVTTAARLFAEQVIIPRADLLLRGWQQLADKFDENLEVDYKSPVPDDEDFRLEAMKAAPWAATVNEWRNIQGLESLGEQGEVFLVSSGVMAVTDVSTVKPPVVSATQVVEAAKSSDRGGVCGGCKTNKAPVIKTFTEQLTAAQLQVLNEIIEQVVTPQPLEQELNPEVNKTQQKWFVKSAKDLGIAMTFDKFDPRVKDYMQELAVIRIPDMTETSKNELRETLAEGIVKGDSPREMAKRVKEVTSDPEGWRSMRIARTETIRASNFGKQYAWGESNVVDGREWLATESLWDSVRDQHKSLHGQVALMGQPFQSNGSTAMYPGDFGVASLDINCRCTMIPVISEEDMSEEAKLDRVFSVAKEFIRETKTDEKRTADAVLKAWSVWEGDLLEQLVNLERLAITTT